MIKQILLTTGLVSAALLLQSTLAYHNLALFSALPDLALLLLVYLSVQKGSMAGQISGFLSGIVMAFLGAGLRILPEGSVGHVLGVYCFVYALVGYLFGLGKGNLFFDPVVVPFLVGLIATLLQTVLLVVVNTVFQLGQGIEYFFSLRLVIQLGYNAVIAIPFFAVAGWMRQKFTGHRRGFYG